MHAGLITDKDGILGLINGLLEDSNLGLPVALDTECEPFDFKNPLKSHAWQLPLIGVGLYNSKRSGFILAADLPSEFQRILSDTSLVLHNAKFDFEVLETAGWDVSKARFEDTLILSWLLNENRKTHGLKALSAELLGKDPTKFADLPHPVKGTLFYEDDLKKYLPLLAEYCIEDCKNTWELFQLFAKQATPELSKAYYKLELPIIDVIRKMERRGIRMDMKYWSRLKVDVEVAMAVTEKIAREEMGVPKDFNLASTDQLRKFLFEEKKFKVPESFKTEKGKISTDTGTLDYLYKEHKLLYLQALIRLRELNKIYSTYIEGLKEQAVGDIIHSSFHQTGTVTGRFSSSGPNLQQLPRGDQGYDIRRVFIPRDGYKFIIGDYSQAELRIVAYFSGDTAMLKAFEEGKDIHKATADIMGVSRTVAKTINFGVVYGQSAYGLAEHLGITKDEAQKFLNEYERKFPRVMQFMRDCGNQVRTQGFTETVIKRKRRFPEYQKAIGMGDRKWAERMERQAGNSVIQGTAADITKVAMRNIVKKFEDLDAYLLCQIHDELICEVREEDAPKMLELVKTEMEGALDLKTVKMKADVKIANWWVK